MGGMKCIIYGIAVNLGMGIVGAAAKVHFSHSRELSTK
jgi:hypothetical protein